MILLPVISLLIAILAVCVALIAVVIGEEDSRSFDAIILADRGEEEFENDVGERGDSAGDVLGWINPVERDGDASGTQLSLCTRTTGDEEDSTLACTLTLKFEEGSIVAEDYSKPRSATRSRSSRSSAARASTTVRAGT